MGVDAGLAVSTELVEYWFNGFYSALVLGTVWVIGSRKQSSVVKKCVWIGLTLSMYISSTVHCALQWNHLVDSAKASVDGDSTSFATALLHSSPKVEIAGSVFFALNIFMADLLLSWRCWIVWERRWYFALVPVCGSITGMILAALAIHSQIVLLQTNVAVNVIQEHSKVFVTLSNGFFGLSIATSLMATVLISSKILLTQNASRQAGLKTDAQYNGVIEIVVESAALYSITLLLFVILESKHSSILYYPQEIHAQVAGIAPTLIVLRVASGNSRAESDWGTKQSTLRFAGSKTTTIGSENGEMAMVEIN